LVCTIAGSGTRASRSGVTSRTTRAFSPISFEARTRSSAPALRPCRDSSRPKPLSAKVEATADAVRTEHAVTGKAVVRGYAKTRHKAKSWTRERRAVARIEATSLGLDIQ
jgi:hypothetical protein